jgi:L-malate glycosyltransferase
MSGVLVLYSRVYHPRYQLKSGFTGGAQKSCLQIVKHLSAKGSSIYLASDDNSKLIATQEKINHFRVPFRSGLFGGVFSFIKLFRIITKNNIQIIHANDRFTSMYAYILSKLCNTKYVYTERNIRHDKLYTNVFLGKNIIAISNAVKNNLVERFNASTKNISVIYNGSAVPKPNEGILDTLFDRFSISTDEIVVSVIGRLAKQKGHFYLLEALKILKKQQPDISYLKLLIVGDGELKAELQSKATNDSLTDNVVFCGHQPNVAEIIHMSNFTVLPSLWEGFGLSAIESFSMAKPVIASNVGGLSEVVDHKINGLLVPAKDPEALANAIIHFITNPAKVKEMGDNALTKYKSKYTPEKMAASYEQYYSHILAE